MTGDRDRPDEEGRTVFVPPAAGTPAASAPTSTPGRVEVGQVLNHIYEVKRLIGRGGMGEVYEAVNVNSDERVAIKVMLPSLAADADVQAMFRREARTLTRISHPAVATFRVLAQEPQLGVLYIVTEFVDGVALSELIGRRTFTASDLAQLLRRLAEGLGAAHELGAVHRDISPDNILLPGGRLDHAKIIDFGIAKDLDPGKGTIVGDGFAGKLGFVAPEQLGDYGRKVGPWTDVYSLGLVTLAAACGGRFDMGATLVEAVDRRRAGCDIAAAPPELQPVLRGMLQADPARRFQSMDEVSAALDAAGGTVRRAPAPPAGSAPRTPARASRLLWSLGALGLLLALVGGFIFFQRRPAPDQAAPPAAVTADAGPDRIRGIVETALPGVRCAWLDLVEAQMTNGAARISVSGVAGNPASAQADIAEAVQQSGLPVADIDQRQVAPVSPAVCRALDAFRPFKAATSSGARLTSAQREYELMPYQGLARPEARAVIQMAIHDPGQDFALFGIEPSGKVVTIAANRAAFTGPGNTLVERRPNDNFVMTLRTFEVQGWTGIVLLTGRPPFEADLIESTPAEQGQDWQTRIRQAGRERDWRAEMVWYRVVDDQPDPAASPRSARSGSP
jgi:hypothetical protein